MQLLHWIVVFRTHPPPPPPVVVTTAAGSASDWSATANSDHGTATDEKVAQRHPVALDAVEVRHSESEPVRI